jgi:DNA-binding CsgD family transcriptional regulator
MTAGRQPPTSNPCHAVASAKADPITHSAFRIPHSAFQIARWIASRDPNPLCWEKEGRRLIVSLRDRSVKDARCYLVREAGPELASFTPREISILYWLVMGKTSVEIGLILGLAANTIKKHLTTIFGKQGVEHRTAAALYARKFFTDGEAPVAK